MTIDRPAAEQAEHTGYRERLWPAWWAVLVTGIPTLMVAFAYGVALGAPIGWTVAGIGVVLTALAIIVSAPRITVTQGSLRVGRATLPASAVGVAQVADAAHIAELRGPGGDARLYVALRPWSAPRGVLVQVEDTDDPHPAWLFTSRHPDRVVAALDATMAR